MDIDIKKQKILIVDDMPINVQVLAEALKSDYQLKIATKGEKALEIAMSDDPPDLILLDIVMPGMDGYEVIRRLKNDSRTQNIPVIFITVKEEVKDEAMGLELGAADYIPKPFQLAIVKARVKTQIELKKARDTQKEVISRLQDALAQVKQLSGLLPICASCKKIRDDKGYWNQIEAYIKDHSEAEFSHGICPGCAKRLYPDLTIE